MALSRVAAFSSFLLLFAFLTNVFAGEDVCQDKNVQHITQYLEEEHLVKIEEQLEMKQILSKLLQSSIESKLAEKTMAETLENVQKQVQQLADVNKVQNEEKEMLIARFNAEIKSMVL